MLPNITFFCELETPALQELFANRQVLDDLIALRARVSLGLLDLSDERAAVAQALNAAGVPLDAWLLLPRPDGYWLSAANAPAAAGRFHVFQEWVAAHNLRFEAVGLDVEPEIGEVEAVMGRRWSSLLRQAPALLRRLFDYRAHRTATRQYAGLAAEITAAGWRVESYQLPIIADQRSARTGLLGRLTGIVDIPVQREVWMLYTSFAGRSGPGILWSYARRAQAIAVGSTGGGVDPGPGLHRPLTWNELARDLRLAWRWTNRLYIFSLEGCVRQGFLANLRSFRPDEPMLTPDESAQAVSGIRRTLQTILWLLNRGWIILAGALAAGLLASALSRRRKNRV